MEKDSGTKFNKLKVDGGASNNNLLMQIQSNFLKTTVVRPRTTETTALGAAFLAGLGSGFWSSIEEIKDLWKIDKVFNPSDNNNDQLVLNNWKKRIKKIQ
jgi:glycerol kinase